MDRNGEQKMTYEERLKKAEENGYAPVMIVGEGFTFFVEKGEYQIGQTVTDSLGAEFVIKYIGKSGRMKATRV